MELHKKTKHPELLEFHHHRRFRGCCRGYSRYPNRPKDFESTKYEIFFNNIPRCAEEGKTFDILKVIIKVFDFIYKGCFMDKLFSHPKSFEEIVILKNLINDIPISDKPKNEKSCDEVFYEYLKTFKNKTNEKYFTLLIIFILLFRECYYNIKEKETKEEEKQMMTEHILPDELPDICSEFYGEFLGNNNYFDLDDNDRNEIIEIIQHFCCWLFKNEYTKDKLTLVE